MIPLIAIGCDGTAGNTGGAIRLFQLPRSRPLQWFVCFLHANELRLRHLLKSFNGATSLRVRYTDSIGRALATCEKLPIKQFYFTVYFAFFAFTVNLHSIRCCPFFNVFAFFLKEYALFRPHFYKSISSLTKQSRTGQKFSGNFFCKGIQLYFEISL